ncbi:beta strand repeat-containing protein, partial [Flavobacterium sp.]|uniref:beta strand repeat-containing protein n=1 Tax=Flavobacterium sp. TaxID=239 RepID=UPI0037BF971B
MIEINSLKIYYKENSLYNFIKINIRLFSVFWMLFFVVDGFAVTRTWDGGAGTLVWTTAANWSGDAIPVAGDDVVFNTTGIFNITSVPILSLNSLTITSGNVTFSSLSSSTLTIGGIVGIDFAISNGASFVLGTNLSITMATSSTADIRGAFTINASRTWTITYSTTCTVGSIGSITNSGTITGATAAKLIFEDNSSYTHAQNGGAIPTADWNGATGTSTSTCYITGMVATAPTGVNQNFYNLVWNCASQTGSANMNGSLTILNNFSVSNTNTGSLFVGVGSGQINRTVTINGNMTLTAGRFYVNGSSSTGTNALIVNGSTNINGGTFAIHSSGLSTSSASFTAGDIIIANGATFDCGLSSNVTTINFKGSVTNTGTGIFKSSSTTPAIIFNGNGSTQIYNMSSSGYNNTNLLLWSIASGAVVQLNSNITLPKGSQSVLSTFTVSGTLDFGTNSSNELYVGIGLGFSSNSGDIFTLNSGGTLKITSVNGILASGSSIGNIRTVGSGKLSLDQAGNYHYIGDAAQVTGAALPVSITGSLVINNRSNVSGTGVSLSQATTIASPGVLTLTAGVLTTTTNLLSITNTSAAAIIGGNSTSFVNGPLRWTLVNSGGVNYKFQIGKSGNYLPLNVGSPVGTTPVITAQAYNANSNGSAGSGLERISNTEYWSISNTGTLTSSTISLGKENIGVNNAISSSTTLNGTYTDNLGTCSITNTLITSNTIKATNSSGSFLSPTYFVMSSKTCSAAMKYWAGAGSTVIGATNGTDFNAAANWSSDSVNKIDTSAPASCHDVTMSTNIALNLTLSENTRIKSLTITNGNNDVSLTALAPYNFEISSNITNTGNMLFGNNTSIILNGTSTLQIIGSSNDKALTFNNLQ